MQVCVHPVAIGIALMALHAFVRARPVATPRPPQGLKSRADIPRRGHMGHACPKGVDRHHGRGDPATYSTFAPEALITGANFFSSATRKEAVSAGLIQKGVAPCLSKAASTALLSSAFFDRAESFSTIA